MTPDRSERAGLVVDGDVVTALDRALVLAEKATPWAWSLDTGGDVTMDDGTTLLTREQPSGIRLDESFANAEVAAAAVNLLRDHGPALRTALATHPGVSREWLPIESAPMGKLVLVCVAGDDTSVGEAFLTDRGNWRTMDALNGSVTTYIQGHLTHWRNKPAAAPSDGVAP